MLLLLILVLSSFRKWTFIGHKSFLIIYQQNSLFTIKCFTFHFNLHIILINSVSGLIRNNWSVFIGDFPLDLITFSAAKPMKNSHLMGGNVGTQEIGWRTHWLILRSRWSLAKKCTPWKGVANWQTLNLIPFLILVFFWIHTVHYSKLVGRARKRLRKGENKKDIRKYRKKRNQIVKN